MMILQKYTFGMGDRFAHQGDAQLAAILAARDAEICVYPVWNKSNREHLLVGSHPADLKAEADAAIRAAGWLGDYYVDADHINLQTVDAFIPSSNFFTLDVADFTGNPAPAFEIDAFTIKMTALGGNLVIPGIAEPLLLDEGTIRHTAEKFLFAMQQAGKIYRQIKSQKGAEHFVTEVSVDETDLPQSPLELLLILAMIAQEGIPAQTIAPKFTGRFNKGVDYVGDLAQFEREFDQDLCIIAYAIEHFGLPASLKLSVHSGSDKFSLYPIINRLIKKHDVGLHVKTAGTTWLEEMIGLAQAGGEALEIAKEIYAMAYPHAAELVAPYAPVVDIDLQQLPRPEEVARWDSEKFATTLRHDVTHPNYDLQFRQFIHVSFKMAAKLGIRYTGALKSFAPTISKGVTENLFERHIKPIFF